MVEKKRKLFVRSVDYAKLIGHWHNFSQITAKLGLVPVENSNNRKVVNPYPVQFKLLTIKQICFNWLNGIMSVCVVKIMLLEDHVLQKI